MTSPIHLLHMEDDATDRRAFDRLVRDRGLPWRVSVATSLAEARDQLATSHFDLIIADYHLPDGECTELFGEASHIPFILLTATLEEHLALRTLERGADDYLPKDPHQHYLNVLPFAVDKTLHRQRLYDAEQRLTQQLRDSEERLRLLVEGVRDYAIFMLDPQGRVATWNRGAEQLKGYTSDQIIGKHFSICYTPEDVADGKPEQMLAAALTQGNCASEGWLVRRNGDRYWSRISITPLHDENGELRGFAKVSQDLTERKRMEDELRELTQTLEQRVACRTAEAEQKAVQLRRLHARLTSVEQRERKHLARMLHDGLQQILVASKMGLETLEVGGQQGQEHLQRIDDLLDQAIDACRSLTANLVPPVLFDRGLVAGLHWLARHSEKEHACTVTVEAEEEAEPTREDIRVMLFEAARELIFNAIKHADVCHVAVSLKCEPDRRHIRLTVEDEGPGFDPAEAELQGSENDGYGLFNLRERAQAAGGELTIDSAPGNGTRVTITAPLLKPDAAPEQVGLTLPPDAASLPGVESDTIRVLLADDHKAMRDGIASLLRGEPDIEVVGEAADGQEAVELAHQLRPDVIIMDVTMPRLDGIEATRHIRQRLPNTCIVGLSMHSDPSVAEAMQKAGAAIYLSKDGPLHAMVDAVRRCASFN
ncbi:MAG: response regulator [Phycisphaeraceae bacterium]